jgi:hypothetical protein
LKLSRNSRTAENNLGIWSCEKRLSESAQFDEALVQSYFTT